MPGLRRHARGPLPRLPPDGPRMSQLLEHHVAFRGGSRELLKYRGPEAVLSGPAGTGKSRAALTKVHLALLLKPGAKAIMLRKTAKSLSSTTVVTYREKVAKEALESGSVAFYGGSAQEPASFRYDNGSTLVLGGMDSPDKILSSEYDLIFVDECNQLTEDDWNTLLSRLRNGVLSYQQLIGCCNPDKPTHWILSRARGALRHLYSRHQDNPAYYDEDGTPTAAGRAYMTILKSLTGVRGSRLFKGLWVAAEGLVYDEFDPAVHMLDQFTIPQEWRRYWVIDFGFSNPFVLQFWAEDPDGRLYLYREIYKTKTLVEDHAKHAISLVTDKDGNWTEPRPYRVIADPADAEGRASFTKHSGLNTVEAKKSKKEGIQETKKRFEIQADKKPRIYFLRDALVSADKWLEEAKKPVCTEQEISGYVWPDGKTGDKAEEPVKEDDHGMDCLRYLCNELSTGRRPRYRSFTMGH